MKRTAAGVGVVGQGGASLPKGRSRSPAPPRRCAHRRAAAGPRAGVPTNRPARRRCRDRGCLWRSGRRRRPRQCWCLTRGAMRGKGHAETLSTSGGSSSAGEATCRSGISQGSNRLAGHQDSQRPSTRLKLQKRRRPPQRYPPVSSGQRRTPAARRVPAVAGQDRGAGPGKAARWRPRSPLARRPVTGRPGTGGLPVPFNRLARWQA